MAIKVHHLRPAPGAKKDKNRKGRGEASKGKTAGRGTKGSGARRNYSAAFEGGQMPLQRRVPKFGFKNHNRVEYKAINLDTLQALADSIGTKVITFETLYTNGLVSKSDLVKILSRGSVTSALEVTVKGFSGAAKTAIEAAGGKAIVG